MSGRSAPRGGGLLFLPLLIKVLDAGEICPNVCCRRRRESFKVIRLTLNGQRPLHEFCSLQQRLGDLDGSD